jgi:hypothetical protein
MIAEQPVQLRLPPPAGFCSAKFCENRISAANTDGICDECHLHPLVYIEKPCARCRRAERRPGDCYCTECRNTIALANVYKRRKERNAPGNLCARCHKEPRVKHTSYCRECSRAYQRERQQHRGRAVAA